MKRGLIIIVLVAAAAFGAHHYYTRQIEQGLDEMAANLQMFGRLDYGDVVVIPTGAVRVEYVRFRTHDGLEAFRMDRATLRAGNLWALWRLTSELDDGRAPRELGIEVEGLRVTQGGGVMGVDGSASDDLLGLDAAGCGEHEGFTESHLAEMGYTTMVADVALDYRLLGEGERLQFGMRGAIEDLGEFRGRFELDVGAGSRDSTAMAMAMMNASIARIDVGYRDLGFAERVTAFCTAETGLERAAYREQHLTAWQEHWHTLGLVAGPNLTEAYRRFLGEPGELSVILRPARRLELSNFGRLPPETLLREFDGTLSVNGAEVGRLDLRAMRPSEREAYRAERRAAGLGDAGTGAAAADSTGAGGGDGTRVLATAELADFAGRRASVRLVGGREFVGRIEEVDGDQLRMRQRMSGGYVVIPYALENVAEVRVRR